MSQKSKQKLLNTKKKTRTYMSIGRTSEISQESLLWMKVSKDGNVYCIVGHLPFKSQG